MIDIRLPQITGVTEKEQLSQVKSYLYQFAEQLQWALSNIEASNNTGIIKETPKSLYPSITSSTKDAEATFASIKALIIKSADIVQAYYDEISTRLEGVYVAQSDFGDFVEKTTQEIESNSTSTTQRFENIQVTINNQNKNIESIDGSLVTMGQDISYAQNDILNLNSNIENLDSNLGKLESEVSEFDTSLETTKTDLNGRIDDTNSSIEGLGDRINDADNKITDVNKDLQDAKDIINSGIQGVQDGVTGVNALLEDVKSQLQGSIDDLNVYITGLQNVIIGVTAYLKSGLLKLT